MHTLFKQSHQDAEPTVSVDLASVGVIAQVPETEAERNMRPDPKGYYYNLFVGTSNFRVWSLLTLEELHTQAGGDGKKPSKKPGKTG